MATLERFFYRPRQRRMRLRGLSSARLLMFVSLLTASVSTDADYTRDVPSGLHPVSALQEPDRGGRLFQKGLSAYSAGHYQEAVRIWRPLAEQGMMDAQFNLGAMYNNGVGVEQDMATAVRWYRKAAEQGYAVAQYNVGVAYARGLGVIGDIGQATRWWRLAAEQDYSEAQFSLGLIYANGHGVDASMTEAAKWWRTAAENGHAVAQFNLGVLYSKGEGVDKNAVQAVNWWRQSADQGYERAVQILQALAESLRVTRASSQD